jgi:hypothetical protein
MKECDNLHIAESEKFFRQAPRSLDDKPMSSASANRLRIKNHVDNRSKGITFRQIILWRWTWFPTLIVMILIGLWSWTVMVTLIRNILMRTIVGWSPFVTLIVLAGIYNPEGRCG